MALWPASLEDSRLQSSSCYFIGLHHQQLHFVQLFTEFCAYLEAQQMVEAVSCCKSCFLYVARGAPPPHIFIIIFILQP